MALLTHDEKIAMTTGRGTPEVKKSALQKLADLQERLVNTEYVRRRDALIPEAAQYAEKMNADHVMKNGIGSNMVHGRAFHAKMNELARARGLMR